MTRFRPLRHPIGVILAASLSVMAVAVVAMTAVIIAAIDGDDDGFSDDLEQFIGTDPLAGCNSTDVGDDEDLDAWPPDLNDDQSIDVNDIVNLRPRYGLNDGDSEYNPRFDLDGDGAIGVFDITTLRNFYGEFCEPVATATPTPPSAATPTPGSTATPAPTPNEGWAFLETFDGTPSGPTQAGLPDSFDFVATHRTDPNTPDGTDANGSYGSFPADHGSDCSGPPNQHMVETDHRSNAASPDGSFFHCNNHMMSSMGEVAGYSVSAFWPRQEFDFTNGGVLQFDVNINAPHDRNWWEILIAPREFLQPGAAKDWLPIDETYPAERIVFEFEGKSYRRMHVGTGAVPPDGKIASESECGNPCWWGANHRHPNDPALTDRRIRRTMRIEIEEHSISWGIETEDGSFDTITMDVPDGLPFHRGLVLFKTHGYTPEKADNYNIYTFHWDNIAFTGPVLPQYEVFESPEVIGRMNSIGSTDTQEIDLPYIAEDLFLFGQVHHGLQGQVLLSINGAPNIAVEPHTGAGCRNGGWRSFMIPLDPSDLRVGTNTFQWTVGPRPACAEGEWYPNGLSVKALEVQMTPTGAQASRMAPSEPVVLAATSSAGALADEQPFACSFDTRPGPPGGFILDERLAPRSVEYVPYAATQNRLSRLS